MSTDSAAAVAAIAPITAVPKVLETVAFVTRMRFAAVARVTDTTWTACAVRDTLGFGLLPGGELPLETTICNEIRQHHQAVVFGHASQHPHFSTHPTPRMYGLESYISVPIFRADRSFFGTLCAIDSVPADLDDPAILGTLQLLAELIGNQLEIEDHLARHRLQLNEALELRRLRERVASVIDRDLRDPLQSIITGLYLMRSGPTLGAEDQAHIAHMEIASQRIVTLLRDIHDFAGGNLAQGTTFNAIAGTELAAELRRIIALAAAAQPGREIQATIHIDGDVTCDRMRLARLLECLLSRAGTTRPAHAPIHVDAGVDGGILRVQVRAGTDAPDGPGRDEGPGIDVFIASEIAKAHGGILQVERTGDGELRAVFEMAAGTP